MNPYHFIAHRITRTEKATFSKIISKIAVITITISLAIILVSLGIFMGFQKRIHTKLFSFAGHVQVTKMSNNESYLAPPLSKNTFLYKDFDKIKGVEKVQGFATKPGILQTDTEIQGVVIRATDQKPDFHPDEIEEGEFPAFKEKPFSLDIVISRKIANKLHLALGDSVIMYFVQDPPKARKLRISAIYNTGMEELDEVFVWGDIKLIRNLNKWSDTLVGGYEVFVKDFAQVDELASEEIYQAMEIDTGYKTVKMMFPDLFDWLILLDKNVNIFLTLILFIACFNMVTMLLIMIMERVQMIGLLKAFGAKNWQIQQIFIYKGLRLLLRGLFWGNFIGLGLCALQYFFKIIPLDIENYYMSSVPIEWNWFGIILLNVLTFMLITIILLVPTFIISRIRPIKAIRFDS